MSRNWEESINYLNQYAEVTEEIEKVIKSHIKRYGLTEEVCAWYSDWQDFCSDWCNDIGYSKTEARALLHGGKGEFKIIKGFGIVRFVL